jgi:hypothetical protein
MLISRPNVSNPNKLLPSNVLPVVKKKTIEDFLVKGNMPISHLFASLGCIQG